jgi:S1-C subfamily serine protease
MTRVSIADVAAGESGASKVRGAEAAQGGGRPPPAAEKQSWRSGVLPPRAATCAGLVLTVAVAGCTGASTAQAVFANDYACPDARSYYAGGDGRWLVRGCGRSLVYVCASHQDCREVSPPAPPPQQAQRPEGAPPHEPSLAGPQIQLVEEADRTVMALELLLDSDTRLRVTASSDDHTDVVQIQLMQPDDGADGCGLEWTLDGRVVATPRATASRKGAAFSLRLQIDRELVRTFGTAGSIALRACEHRWALTTPQLSKIHEFMSRFEGERAWSASGHQGPTALREGSRFPWPEWKAAGKAPRSVGGQARDARSLFKLLSPSVFLVEAPSATGTSWGSAVSVSKTELLTNCHVVASAARIVLHHESRSWRATLSRSDQATDRCVLTTSETELRPVVGVRTFESLEVGEPVYTLGSPDMFELTLASGMVSGKRDAQGRHFVQTTAPISPGSSGGGLFDARGNLVGITQLTWLGNRGIDQQLNFAIAAESFWQP